jgi:hypothetical protein
VRPFLPDPVDVVFADRRVVDDRISCAGVRRQGTDRNSSVPRSSAINSEGASKGEMPGLEMRWAS